MSEQFQNNKTVTGGSGITAGNDVSIGDVTGQQAIGEYINQIMLNIEELSAEELVKLIDNLEQKRKEKVNLEILNSYTPSALPYFDHKVKKFVTTNRVEELNNALVYLQDHRLLLFTGIGGVGKTTLARALVDIRPANVPIPFWFDFRMNQSAKLGDILEKLAAYMNCPDLAIFKEEKREPDINDINKLTDKLEVRNPVWLIFDNLKTILDDVYFKDENMDLFFTCLRNSSYEAKIIITSRIFPKLKNGECLIDAIEGDKQDIKGLKINFAIDYLVRNGLGNLEPDKLEELATGVDCHPLALQLLVGLVKKFGVSDTLKDLTRYKNLKENTIKKIRRLFDNLAGDEKELLERISVYRQAETMDAIEIMLTDKTPKEAIDKLIDKSLLETDHNGSYWLHPLVQEFSYEDLKSKKEAHLVAYNYYKSLNLPENPIKKEDLQPAIEAHYHACEAGEYDLAADIIWKFNIHNLLDLWGYSRTLIEIYEKLLPKDHFKAEPILKDKKVHGAVLGNLGLAYSDLGDAKKAIDYYEQALKIAREIGDIRGEGNRLGNLGNAYSALGDAKKAIDYYEQALKIAREIGDRRGEGADLGNLGLAYSALGDAKKAIDYYEQALKIAREIGDRRGEGNHLGNLGLAYSALGDAKKAIDYYEQALKIAREIGDIRGEGNRLGNLGLAYSDLGDVKKAIDYYEQALKIDLEIGDRRGEGNRLGNLGNAYRDLGDAKKAIDYYEQALKIDLEIGDRRGEGADLGNMGNAYRDLGDAKKAIDYYEQALKIAREIGNRRGEGNHLGNLGLAYSALGDAKKAIDYYEQALKIAREIGNRRGEGNRLGNLGLAYSALGDAKKAIDYYEQALKIAREIGDRRGEGAWLGNMGNAYRALGDAKKAIDYYEQALKIAREIGDIRGEGNRLGNLGLAYSALGDVKKVIDYYEQAFELNPEDGTACYNKACAESLMDKKSKALVYLKRAVELDPSYRELAKSDKDFEKLWEDQDFKDIIAVNQG
jgi:tetratricopeptide (TPR) repeat protein